MWETNILVKPFITIKPQFSVEKQFNKTKRSLSRSSPGNRNMHSTLPREDFPLGHNYDTVPAPVLCRVHLSSLPLALPAEQGSLASHSKTQLHSSSSETFISAHHEATEERGIF